MSEPLAEAVVQIAVDVSGLTSGLEVARNRIDRLSSADTVVKIKADSDGVAEKIEDVKAAIAGLEQSANVIPIGVDASGLRSDVEAAKAEVDKLSDTEAVVKITADKSELNDAKAEVDAFKSTEAVVTITADNAALTGIQADIARLSSTEAVVHVTADGTGLAAEVEAAKTQLDQLSSNAAVVTISANDADLMTELGSAEAQLAKLKDSSATVNVVGDVTRLESQIKSLRSMIAQLKAEAKVVPIEPSPASLSNWQTLQAKIKQTLKTTNEEGGKSSALGQSAKLLKGAGAVVGVSMIGQELDKVTAKAAELSEQFRRGEVDAAGLAVGIGESLPAIGGFVSAGQNIREMFTHEKAELKEINDSIALGNQLMEMRVRASEQVRSATHSLNEETAGFQDKALVLNTKGEKAKAAVQVEIEYHSDTRKLQDETRKAIEARRKTLLEAETTIEDAYQKGPKNDKTIHERNDKMGAAQRVGAADIKHIEEASKEAQAAMDQWHDAAARDAQGIQKELDKLAEESNKKLAVTDNEKIANYADELKRAGYTAQQSTPLIQAFANSLKTDKYAEYKQSYQDLIKEIQTLGTTARETAINQAVFKGASPSDVRAFTEAYDQLQQKLKTAKIGDLLQQMNEQVATFGTTDMDRLIAKLNFNFATPEQRKQAIDLQIKVEGQEKAQKVADLIKTMKDEAAEFGATPLEALNAKLNLLNATPEQRKQAIDLEVKIEGQEKAKTLAEDLKKINEEFKDAGKSDLQKQIDEMTRLSQQAGNAAQMVGAIADAKAKLEKMKVDDFVRDQKAQAAEVGKSEPDKAVEKLKASGVTDPKLLADAWTAAAKKAGAELAHSLETPFQKYQEKMAELGKLLNAKAIDQKTFNAGRANAAKEYQSGLGGPKSIEQAFKDNLSKQFTDFGIGKAQKADKDKAAAAAKAAAEERKKNTKAVQDNTDQLKNLNGILGNGLQATFA